MPTHDPTTHKPSAQRGIQSIEVGGQLLLALAHHGQAMTLKDLAQASGMAAAKAHPYLVSFCKLGLIEQDGHTGRYGLGPLAMQLGLISLQQYDPIRLASPVAAALAEATGHCIGLAVWGQSGPTVVRVEAPPTPVHMSLRHGTVMSLRGTASGRLFAAYAPSAQLQALLNQENAADETAWQAELDHIRRTGMSYTADAALPGVSALAAPIFDSAGRMVMSLIAVGASSQLTPAPNGVVAQAVRAAAQDVSARLGHVPSETTQA